MSDVPYPDITDILDRKAQGRRDLAALSYGEKIRRVERMRDELAGLARAREALKDRASDLPPANGDGRCSG